MVPAVCIRKAAKTGCKKRYELVYEVVFLTSGGLVWSITEA